ncbi:MAG: hypothetical protein KA104_01190 [Candidatus Pacebacteria bacterium]|nr:hypothetical protein [Candidatus Paceibacterota bacterium]
MGIFSAGPLGAVVGLLAIGVFVGGGLAWTIRGGWMRQPKKKKTGRFTMFPAND